MLTISQSNIDQLKLIRDKYLSGINVPDEGNWKEKSNNELWLTIFAQVVVVGKSSPVEILKSNDEYRNKIAYEKLITINDDETLGAMINEVLCSIGARYASKDIERCRKTKALVYNFNKIRSFPEGPVGFFAYLEGINGNNSEKKRIDYVIDHFKFIKNKSARDLLMELGLIRNAIALDVRVVNILRQIGINVPDGYENNAKLYAEIEKDILDNICTPLNLSGIQLDRLIYNSYKDIILK